MEKRLIIILVSLVNVLLVLGDVKIGEEMKNDLDNLEDNSIVLKSIIEEDNQANYVSQEFLSDDGASEDDDVDDDDDEMVIENEQLEKSNSQMETKTWDLSAHFKKFYAFLLSESDNEKAPVDISANNKAQTPGNRNIIDAPDGSKCPPGQRPDANGRCRTPLW